MSRLGSLLLMPAVLLVGWVGIPESSNGQEMKQLASGVLKTIPSNLNPRDSYSFPRPMVGLDAAEYQPNYIAKSETLFGQSRRVIMFRDVWEYEFAFTGLRQANLLVPDSSGVAKKKNVWYMIFRVRDRGNTLTYEKVLQNPEFEQIKYDLKRDQPIPPEKKFFMPRFSLEGWINSSAGSQKVVYDDIVSPMVVRQIQRREDKNLKLLDTYSISKVNVPLAKTDVEGGVWGVAVWQNVDPRLDFVSVYVRGLTNAYRFGRTPELPNLKKTLQLNFHRPGDIVAEETDDVILGIPLYDDTQKQILVCKRYDLPGPLVRIYQISKIAANRKVLVAEADAQIDLTTLRSAITPELDAGTLPESVSQAFANSGITVNKQAAVEEVVQGQRWRVKEGDEEYVMILEPQFWERKVGGGIRFINSLEHMWIYR